MNIFHETFSSGQVIDAAGITNHALQSWLRRDLVIGQKKIEGGGSPGSYRRFSFRNVMEIAIAKALTDVGASSLESAFRAANLFAHVGGTEPGDNVDRIPGLPFDWRNGPRLTILVVAGDRAAVTHWSQGCDFYVTARHRLDARGFVSLEVDPIFERVAHVLGYDYRDILNFAYPPKVGNE